MTSITASAALSTSAGIGPSTSANFRKSIDEIETSGIPFDDIGLALSTNWPATVTALALRRIGCLRAIIAEAKQPWT